jgi:dihydroorotate dehydrogenase electron transfer subunit
MDMPIDVHAAIIANTRLSDDYNVVALQAPDVASLAEPGQFVMIQPSAGLDPLLRRPFSIFEILRDSSNTPTGITILNKRIGAGTALLYDAAPGMRLKCLGPLGRPFVPLPPPGEAWMVAGGVGLAPFITLAEALRDLGATPRLFYGARRAAELTHVEAFEQRGVQVVLATEDGSRGVRGFVTTPLDAALRAAPRDGEIRLYACGPTPMMKAVAHLAASHGRRCDVSLEQVMGCGLGGCYSCVVLTRTPGAPPHFLRSCIDGPVFDAAHIVWDGLTH